MLPATVTKSVYNALELCGLTPKYIVPKVDKEFGINCSITPSQAEKAIRENPDAKLLIITSPTYEGAGIRYRRDKQNCAFT